MLASVRREPAEGLTVWGTQHPDDLATRTSRRVIDPGHLDPVFVDALQSADAEPVTRAGTFRQVAWHLLGRRTLGGPSPRAAPHGHGPRRHLAHPYKRAHHPHGGPRVAIDELTQVPQRKIRRKLRQVVEAAVAHLGYRNFAILGAPRADPHAPSSVSSAGLRSRAEGCQ